MPTATMPTSSQNPFTMSPQESDACASSSAGNQSYPKLMPLGTTTYDSKGRHTLMMKDVESGRRTTLSEYIDFSWQRTANDGKVSRFMHGLDGLVSWYMFDKWRFAPMRYLLQAVCFPVLVVRMVHRTWKCGYLSGLPSVIRSEVAGRSR